MKQQSDKAGALSYDELSVFCYQLSLMLQSGIGSEEGLFILKDDAADPKSKTLLTRIHSHLAEGAPLSVALEDTGLFPDYLLRMVEIGQASGRLDQVLGALSDYYQRESDTQRSLRRAVAYPAVMAVLIAVIFLVLVSRVLPVFQQVFQQLGMSLSPVAQTLMQLGSASKWVAGVLAVVLIVCAILLLVLFREKNGGGAYMKLFGKTKPAQAVDRSRFSSVMALMLSSGLSLDEAMQRTCMLLEHSHLAPQLQDCARRMDGGESFPNAVEQAGILTGIQAGLLAAGFRAGVSDRAMEELARRSQQEADEGLARMLGRFEYGLVAVLCVAVGLVLLSVMLPLLGVLSAIGG